MKNLSGADSCGQDPVRAAPVLRFDPGTLALSLFLFVSILCLLPTLGAGGLVLVLLQFLFCLGARYRTSRGMRGAALDAYALGALAALLPIAPTFGAGVVSALCAVTLLAEPRRVDRASLVALAPWLAVVVAGQSAELVLSLDVHGLRAWLSEARKGSGLPPFLPGMSALYDLLRWVLAALLFARTRAERGALGAVTYGLFAGLAGAALLGAAELAGLLSIPRPSQPFFEALGRHSFTFTDPNAAGIWLVLMVPLVVGARDRGEPRWVTALLLPLVILLGLYAGSRSFLLGLAAYGAVLLFRARPRLCYLAGGVLALVLLVLQFDAPYRSLVASGGLPVGAQRAIESVRLDSLGPALFSRSVFLQLTSEVWTSSPLFGVGSGRFRDLVVPRAARSGLDIGLWNDNANNFYMGVLAESGIIGLVALVLSVMMLLGTGERSRNRASFRHSMLLFAALLFLGPHIEFEEVAMLAALLSGIALEGCSTFRVPPLRLAVFASFAALGIVLSTLSSDRGFYAWERDGGELFRWTGPAARGTVACDGSNVARLVVRAFPMPGGVPQHVTVDLGRTNLGLSLSGGETKPIEILCDSLQAVPGQALFYRLHADPWIPAAMGMGDDRRVLGVQVRGIPSLREPRFARLAVDEQPK